MKRAELVEKLEIVAPALSPNTIVAVMTHFWFTGTRVMAYNDTIAISVPLKTDFACAVPGVLLQLLKASRAAELELDYNEKEKSLLVKGAGTRIKLGTMSKADFAGIFKMPEPGDSHIDAGKGGMQELVRCTKACLRSVSIDTSVSDYLGVTLIGDEKELLFFSTNHATLSHAVMKLPAPIKFKRALIPTQFCNEMIELSDKEAAKLEIRKDYAFFQGRQGARLFSKLIESERPVDFIAQFESHFPVGSEKKLVAIPTKLELMLERAVVIAQSAVTPVHTKVAVKESKLTFNTEASHSVNDSTAIEKHANVQLSIDPKLVKNGVSSFEKMLLTPRAFIMAGKNEFYMVANSEE